MEDDLKFVVHGKWPQPPRIVSNITSNVKQGTKIKMKDDLNYFLNGRGPQLFVNGRWPQLFCKGKTTSTFLSMDDDLNYFVNGRQPQICCPWKNNLYLLVYWRLPQSCQFKVSIFVVVNEWWLLPFFLKWTTTPIF